MHAFRSAMTTDRPGHACTCFAVRRAARHLTQAYDRLPRADRAAHDPVLAAAASCKRTGPRSIQAWRRRWAWTGRRSAATCARWSARGWSRIGVDPNGPARPRARHHRGRPGQGRGGEALWEAAQARFVETYGDGGDPGAARRAGQPRPARARGGALVLQQTSARKLSPPPVPDDHMVMQHERQRAAAACLISVVIATSSPDGAGSPLGWLWTRISALACSSSARLTTSRG